MIAGLAGNWIVEVLLRKGTIERPLNVAKYNVVINITRLHFLLTIIISFSHLLYKLCDPRMVLWVIWLHI